jgi:hypothetical protein
MDRTAQTRYGSGMTTSPIENGGLSLSAAAAGELRAELGRRGLTQRQLSLRMRRDNVWLSRRIGRTAPVHMTLEDVAEIADALGVEAEGIMVAALRACRDSNPKPSVLEFRARLVAATSTTDLGRRLRLVGAEGVNRGVTENRIPAGWPVPEPHTPLPARESTAPGRHLRSVRREDVAS